MWHHYQYQQNTTTQSNKKITVLVWNTPLRQGCGCLCVCVGVHESNRTRGQPLHKHHILHKHRRGTWLNAAMEAQREKGREREKVSPPAVAPSNRIPFKGTETPNNLPHANTTNMFVEIWVRAGQGPLSFSGYCIKTRRWGWEGQNFTSLLSEHSSLQMHIYMQSYFSYSSRALPLRRPAVSSV